MSPPPSITVHPRRLIGGLIAALVAGCGADIEANTAQFGVPIQTFGLPVADRDSQRSMGGDWQSLRLGPTGPDATPAILRERASGDLQAFGWNAIPCPDRAYVLSEDWGRGADDLCFDHAPADDDPPQVRYFAAVHVPPDAHELIQYVEIAW